MFVASVVIQKCAIHCFAFAANQSAKIWRNYISMGLLQVRATNSKDLG
jgi:hypothetical protein